MIRDRFLKFSMVSAVFLFIMAVVATDVSAVALPGGTLDPATVTKYVTPLVIPPVMKTTGTADNYDIAVRQFKQQILPGGIWNLLNGRTDTFPATTVWSYGPEADPLPGGGLGIAPSPDSQFNYPAYTIETISNSPVSVRWRNELLKDPVACAKSLTPATDANCNYLPHLLAVDQTLHWANPPGTGCTAASMSTTGTECHTLLPTPYLGPVPMVVHVHGAHVDPHSDGYPEAWWLPHANNIPAGYVTEGKMFDDAKGQKKGLNLGYADYYYRNDQPAATIWYHDHSLGMTRLNVYAGPAGFFLVRGGKYDLTAGLPGPAPKAGDTVLELNAPGLVAGTIDKRSGIREIPIAIQDRSFNTDGSLFYPSSRFFFDGYPGPYIPNSDIAPIWNPEVFMNFMVVNGSTWPKFEVAPALYRFRLLDGCNSRTLNLSLFEVDPATNNTIPAKEHPFYQIGAEQGFLPNVVKVMTGSTTVYTAANPAGTVTAAPTIPAQQALLVTLAERADVIVDFRGLTNGTRIRMLNTAPDYPYAGFPAPAADPGTTGQVMEFVVNTALLGKSPTDPNGATPATDPWLLTLSAEAALPTTAVTRDVSLNELDSSQVCAYVDAMGGFISVAAVMTPPQVATLATCGAFVTPPAGAVGAAIPWGPLQALVGTVNKTNPAAPVGVPLMWTDMTGTSKMIHVPLLNGTMYNGMPPMVGVTENPVITSAGAPVEEWNIYNFTVDAHPIHTHLVRFQVINRTPIPGALPVTSVGGVIPVPTPIPQQGWETGYKDSVVAYPGMITTVRARFDVSGLYVWHCHIVEHEDNEMMRPYIISEDGSCGTANGQIFTNAPAMNLCTTGTASAVTPTVVGWGWTCNGKFGGANSAQCSATSHSADIASSIVINSGSAYTNKAAVNLTLTAIDPLGVATMQFSNDGITYSKEVPYAVSYAWTLDTTTGDGLKTVYVRFRDKALPAGNLYGPITASITLDTTPPVTTASPIPGTYASAPVTVTLTANEPATIYYTTNGAAPTTASTVYTKPIKVAATTTINYFAVDLAGNAEAVNTGTWTIHTLDIKASIKINNGAAYTNNTLVALTLSAVDPQGVAMMQFSNDGITYTTEEAYATTRAWILPIGEGPKTVYVRFRDNALGGGFLYDPVTANITLDTTIPVTTVSPIAGTYTTKPLAVTLAANEKATIYYTTDGSAPTTASAKYSTPIPVASSLTINYFAVDLGGNVEAVNSGTWAVHTSDLKASVVINNGAKKTRSANVMLTLKASDPLGIASMQFSNDGVNYTLEEPFATSKAWTLDSAEDGLKTVYVRFRDLALPDGYLYDPVVDSIILDFSPPDAPKKLNAVAKSNGIRLTWLDKSNNENIFTIQRANDASFKNGLASFTVGANIVSFTDTTGVSGRKYWYRVQANNAQGNSGYSNVAKCTAP